MLRIAAVCLAAALFAAPAHAQSSDAGPAELTSCAGAISVVMDLRLEEHYPLRTRTYEAGWPSLLATILNRLSQQEYMQGMTGLDAARAARTYWADRPRSDAQRHVQNCQRRFSS